METPNFDDEFDRAVADWRERHRLREDDAVLLLVDLFRIHQRHWDEIRRRELPSFGQFRGDIAKLAESSGVFQQYATALIEQLKGQSGGTKAATVTRTAAWWASRWRAPGRVAAAAASCAASTMSYSSRCAGLKRPLAGKVRVMSLA